jgi:C4-dicarboxylate-specific signal transduction histidine kinase
MWNLAFLLNRTLDSDDEEGMKTGKINPTSEHSDPQKPAPRPSEFIEPERLTETGRAVADLAHLVKNILQVMSGCGEIIDLALETNQMDRICQAWQLYQPSFWRLKKFQLDLIKYTKNYPLNPQPCDINTLIASAARQIKPFFDRRKVTFIHRPNSAQLTVIADAEKLRDMVVNMLVNAIDNLDDSPGKITLTADLTDAGQTLYLTVSDSGPRLNPAQCRALLMPLERCRNMLGSGLEIPLTAQMVQEHGGSLTMNANASETGNCIEITLPATG